jgi:hypothetical protein
MITYLKNRREYILPYAQELPDREIIVNRRPLNELSNKKFWSDDPTLEGLERLLVEVAI